MEYEKAHGVAEQDLVVTHPVRLGLALNYDVFQYEVIQNPEFECTMPPISFEASRLLSVRIDA